MSTEKGSEFSLLEFGVHLPNGFFKRGIMIRPNQLNEMRYEYSNTGIYATLYHYNSRLIDEAQLYGPFYLDFDADIWDADKETVLANLEKIQEDFRLALLFFEKVFGIPPEYARSYYSGKKGFHLIYPAELFGVEPRGDLNLIYKTMRDEVASYTKHNTIDHRIYDNKRLFRVPNSKHQDTGLYKVPLTPEFLLTATIDDLHQAAMTPKAHTWRPPVLQRMAERQYRLIIDKHDYRVKELERKRKRFGDRKLDYTPPCVETLLEDGAKVGARNNTMAALVSFFKQSGMSEEEALGKTIEWGTTKCVPPIPTFEIKATVPSIYKGEKSYGCSALKDLSVCVPKECKLSGEEVARSA